MNGSSSRFAGSSRVRSGALAGVLVAIAMLPPAAVSQPNGATASVGAAPEVTAQWQSHELQFHYFGTTTYYSCSGFEERLEHILRELGANPDVRVSVINCPGLNDINRTQWARIRVRMPAASAQPGSDTFAATSKAVRLETHRMGQTGSADCELLERVRDTLLPALKMEVLKDDLNCIPGQASHRRTLEVRALIPANGK